MAATLDKCVSEIKRIQKRAREQGDITRPRWPMIILYRPKAGRPKKSMAKSRATSDLTKCRSWSIKTTPTTCAAKKWLRSYKPEELFYRRGRLKPELEGWRQRRPPHGRKPRLPAWTCYCVNCACQTSRDYEVKVPYPQRRRGPTSVHLGPWLRRHETQRG